MAIKNTHNTTKISSIDHEEQSPIIIQNNSIDQAIYEAEQEIFDGAKTISLDKAYTELEILGIIAFVFRFVKFNKKGMSP